MITFKAASFSTQTNKHQNLQKEQVVSVNIKCTVNECWVWWIVLVASGHKVLTQWVIYPLRGGCYLNLWVIFIQLWTDIDFYTPIGSHDLFRLKMLCLGLFFLSLDYWYFWSSSKIYLWIIEYIWNIFIIKTKHRWSVCLRVCVLDMLCPNTSPMFCFIELQK